MYKQLENYINEFKELGKTFYSLEENTEKLSDKAEEAMEEYYEAEDALRTQLYEELDDEVSKHNHTCKCCGSVILEYQNPQERAELEKKIEEKIEKDVKLKQLKDKADKYDEEARKCEDDAYEISRKVEELEDTINNLLDNLIGSEENDFFTISFYQHIC